MNLGRALVTTSLIITGGVLGARYVGMIEAAELAAYDQFVQLAPDLGPDDRILVVGINENDLQKLEEWPISDRTLEQALAALTSHAPVAIAVDIFRDFPQPPGTEALQTQMQQHPNTLIVCKISAANDMGTPPPPWLNPEQVGFSDLVVDPGGILRRNLLMAGTFESATPYPKEHYCNIPGQTLLSLSFRATLLYLQTREIEPGFNEAGQLVLGSTVIPKLDANLGGYQNIDNAGYQLMLSYRSDQNAVEQVSLLDLIEGRVDPQLIRDRLIFIGYTTPQAKDEFYTPYSSGKDDQQKMPGVIVHAQSASQLLATVLDGRALIWTWPTAGELTWIIVWSLVGGLLAWYFRHPAILALIIFSGCAILYGICFVIFLQGGWIPLIPPVITFMGTAVGIVSFDRFNKSAYGQQVYRKVKTFLRLDIDIDEEKVDQQVSEITESDYFQDLKATVKSIRGQSDSAATADDWPHDHETQSWQPHPDDTDAFSHQLDILLHPESASDRAAPHTSDASSPMADQDCSNGLSPDVQAPTPGDDAETVAEDDYWQALSADFQTVKKAAALGEAIAGPTTDQPEMTHSPLVTASDRTSPATTDKADDYELDFLNHIAREAAFIQEQSPVRQQPSSLQPPEVDSSPSPAPITVAHYQRFELNDRDCQYEDGSAPTQTYLAALATKLDRLKTDLQAQED